MGTKEILDTSVAIERDGGVVTVFSVVEYPPCGDEPFEVIFPDVTDYIKAVDVANRLRKIGKPIGAVDILISAMCLNRSARLITNDKDFKNIKEIYPNFELVLND